MLIRVWTCSNRCFDREVQQVRRVRQVRQVEPEELPMTDLVLRSATSDDAAALHALISAHQAEGHLLPRTLDDIRRHAGRFVVCDVAGTIKGCGELAPLSPTVAEIRSLVVARDFRRVGLAARLLLNI